MLSFAFPLFLWGLTALLVPVLLHLMKRAIPVRLVFPSVRFLQKAHMPREGRRQPQDLLLLLLRLLLLAAVVLVFARPKWTPRQASAAVRPERDTVIVADLSASIGGWSGLESLRRHIRDIVATAPEQPIAVVLSSNRVLNVMPPGTSRTRVEEILAKLTVQPVAGEHQAALTQAAHLFQPGRQHTLILVSDFQQTDWQFAVLPSLPPDTEYRLVDINPDRADNAGVTRATVRPLDANTLRVVAEVRNFGNSEARRQVTLRAGGETVTHALTIPPRQVANTAFVVPRSDTSHGLLSLDADAYAADDTYHFWAGQFPPVRVLAVLPGEQDPQAQDELFFIRKALAVNDDASLVSFTVDTAESDALFAMDLDEVRSLLLLGAAGQFREQEFQLLKDFLENGGTALATPGAATAHLFQGLRRHKLLEADFLGIAGGRTRGNEIFGLGWVNPESILGRTFAKPEDTDLFLFAIYQYARLRCPDSVKVLLRTLDDDPALVECTVGKGRLFVSTFAFHTGWSDLPVTGSFLPLVRDLLSTAVPDDWGVIRLECGQPAPQPHTSEFASPGTARTDAPPDTSAPGVFALDGVPCEVNVSRRESVVEKVNLFDLQTQLQSGNATPQDSPAPTAPSVTGGGAARELWPWCAGAAAVLLLGELALALFLDRRELASHVNA
ncbi:MAG: hypothetical protein A3K19_32585 [Lentisphaerae bacterium RIFOXYB12_FULL_65_16]|nr:MAG: hypothetical protein A3K18_07980 [Lentisphaerae bacterium RIFOXYA12_64_32]OGV84434.1 MAG: hypothetical protein A3K19_32585 [Lentisphaerae bacterium RIFOXYB12_FULL_65_16]